MGVPAAIDSQRDRRLPDLWPVVPFAALLALLSLRLVWGERADRISNAVQLAATVASVAYGAFRVRRAVRDEQAEPPSWPSAITTTVVGIGWVWVGIVVLFVLTNMTGRESGGGATGPKWFGTAVAALASVALAVHMAVTVRQLWRREGVERQVFMEATAIAFFVTLVAGGVYALFEYLAGAPRLSMWWLWFFGMVAWGAISTFRMRQLR